MLSQEEKIYVEQACLKLKERGWFPVTTYYHLLEWFIL